MSRTTSTQSRIIAAKQARNANLVRGQVESDAYRRYNAPRKVSLAKPTAPNSPNRSELRAFFHTTLEETLRCLTVRRNYHNLKG